ncbi:hypothetical protein FB45DRAFT_923150 [Roridomyces roridus]|uniref:Thioredoxin-like fold domain-containing protein n=1 Tax=Roridomyces roridus TaxID=1738132 RepID=A0AAD7BNP0_9AGAR|nr:hypothetical protein FB45DRAFT_923150 [Roridomyces roridus]
MALQPSLRGLVIAGTLDSPHTLDIFLDYVCPFSAKIARAMDSVLVPLLGPGGKYHGKVKAIFRPQVQPWHASSTYVHEAGIAVARASPESFWAFSLELFRRQEEYFDSAVEKKTPSQIRSSLASLAAGILPPKAALVVADLIALAGPGNGGTAVSNDLKYTIKFARQNGIHVSPTVLWDGLIANEISSSWAEKEWTEFLTAKVAL